MGQIQFKNYDGINSSHENFGSKKDKEIQSSRYKYIITQISKLSLDQKSVFVFGMGGHIEQTYKSLMSMEGIDLCWYQSTLPLILRPLKIVIASYEGMIQINNLSILLEVFEIVLKNSMAGVYIIDSKIESSFIERSKRLKYPDPIDNYVMEQDSKYFIYQIDADNYESNTGMYEIVNYGKECSEDITNLLF